MPSRRRYRFVIDEAFTPDTLPMARLAEYMGDLANLLGEKPHVHFVEVEGGSAVLVQEVDWEAVPKVRARVRAVRNLEGSREAIKAYESLNARLAADNGFGRLVEEPENPQQERPVRVLEFPGRKQNTQTEYGPFNQPGELYGIVIVVGGEDDPVPVHLEDADTIHICRAKRPLARELAQYLFTTPLRVSGVGRWSRNASGQWSMRNFHINGYVPLNDSPLSTVVEDLRNLPAKWKNTADPLGELRRVRNGDE
jgi:hypothetical protein